MKALGALFAPAGNNSTLSDAVQWTYREDLSKKDSNFGNYSVTALCYNGSIYVAAGYGGRLSYSTDGINWTYTKNLILSGWGSSNSNTDSTYLVNDIAWNGTYFMAVGWGKCAISTDGINWTLKGNIGTNNGRSVIWDNSKWVVGCDAGRIAYSADNGTTWTVRTDLANNGLWSYYSCTDILFVANKYYAFSAAYGTMAISTDLINWTFYRPVNFSNGGYLKVVWTGTRFVTVGTSGRTAYSTDGVNWTTGATVSSYMQTNSAVNGFSIEGVNNNIVIICDNGGIVTSSDGGVSWTNRTSLFNNPKWTKFNNQDYSPVIIWNGSKFIAACEFGKSASSTDGITWNYEDGLSKLYSVFGTFEARTICYNGSIFVAGGENGRIATSSDGAMWTFQPSLLNTTWGLDSKVNSIAWNGSKFVAVGDNCKVATSTDAITWTYNTGISSLAGTSTHLSKVVWFKNKWVAIDGYSRIFTSTDGITWSLINITALSGSGLYSLAASSTTLMMGSGAGKIVTTTDLSTFTVTTSLGSTTWGTSDYVYAIAHDGNKFVIGGPNGKIATSVDGAVWSYVTGLSGTTWSTYTVRDIIWDSRKFIAVGDGGRCATSVNGTSWTYQTGLSGTGTNTDNILAVASSGPKIVAVGVNGDCITSP